MVTCLLISPAISGNTADSPFLLLSDEENKLMSEVEAAVNLTTVSKVSSRILLIATIVDRNEYVEGKAVIVLKYETLANSVCLLL